jgi:DNA-binding transcriptional LysR family regulator
MYLTQPTLTARIKALEDEVGDQLFVRTSRGMRLTEAGRELVPFAERCLGRWTRGSSGCGSYGGLRGGG